MERFHNPVLNDIFGAVRRLGNVDLACAQYTVKILEVITPKVAPIKPKEVIDHEKIPYERRRFWGSDYYKDNPEILPYYCLVDRIRNDNRAQYDWLRKCRTILKDDAGAVCLLEDKMNEFKPRRKERVN